MARPIVVPVDGSSFAEQALPSAIELARRTGAPLELVLVHRPLITSVVLAENVPPLAEAESWQRVDEAAYLTRLTERLAALPGVHVSSTALEGEVADALAGFVAARDARLVVMTTHGRGGLARAWLGSVADRFVRIQHVPVLLLRPSEQAEHPPVLSAPTRVLVPLDGSPVALRALDALEALDAPDVRPTLVLTRIVTPPPTTVDVAAGAVYLPDISSIELEHSARVELFGIAAGLLERGFAVETQVLVHSAPARAIVELATSRHADCIAIATHGAGGVGRLLLGSVADAVMRTSPVPVLVVHPERDGRLPTGERSARFVADRKAAPAVN